MAASAEDAVCQYCLQSYVEMNDPRELPCGHIFCKACLQDDFEMKNAITCPVCRSKYLEVDVDSLPKFCCSETDIIAVEKYKCDTCGDKDAVGFCEKCGELGCSVHKQCHEDLRHPIISLDLYGQRPSSYRKVMCQTHNKEIVLTCDTCSNPTLLACVLCEPESQECPDKTGYQFSSTQHGVITVNGRCDAVRDAFESMSKVSAENIAELCKVEKELWQRFDKFTQAKDEPEGAAAFADTDVPEYSPEQLARLTDAVEKYVDDLAKKKEILEQTQRAMQLLLDKSHPTEIIQNCEDRLMILQEAIDAVCDMNTARRDRCDRIEFAFAEMVQVRPTVCISGLVSVVPKSAVEFPPFAPLRLTFRSLKYITEYDTPQHCYSVSFTGDYEPRLLVACDYRFYLYDDDMDPICSVNAKYPTSAVEYNGLIYFIDERNGGQVKTWSPDFDEIEVLFRYSDPNGLDGPVSHLAVNGGYVAVTEPASNSVVIFNKHDGTAQRYDTYFKPSYIHFNGLSELLVSGTEDGLLSCCTIFEHAQVLVETWQYRLAGARGVCTDSRGHIFLGTDDKKVVHVLSDQGELVGRLSHRHLPLNPGGMSINGDILAIACKDDNSFKLFRFS